MPTSGAAPAAAIPASVSPERAFLALAAPFGLAFLLAIGPFEGADEFAHFLRAFQVSEGGLLARRVDRRVGGWMPRSIGVTRLETLEDIPLHRDRTHDPARIRRMLALPLDPADRLFLDFPNSALASPVSYLPQAAAMGLGRLLGLSPLLLLYLGRGLNLAAWTLLTHAAIRAAPLRKWLLVALALSPVSLFQASTLSADAATNALAALWLACCLRERRETAPLAAGRLALLAALAAALALSKAPYGVLVLLWFLLPWRRFGSRARFAAASAALVGVSAALAVSWAVAVHAINLPHARYNPGYRSGQALVPGADPDLQLARLLAHPGGYAAVVARSAVASAGPVAISFVGQMGWDVVLPAWHALACLALLAALAVVDEPGAGRLGAGARLWLVAVGALAALAAATLLYLVWTPVGGAVIQGLHGRYLIPVAGAVLVGASPGQAVPAPRAAGPVTAGLLGLSLLATLVVLVTRYYA